MLCYVKKQCWKSKTYSLRIMSHRKDISNKNTVAVGPQEGSSLSSVRIYDHLSPRTQAVLFLAKRVCPFHVTRITCQIWNSIPYSIKLLKRSPFCKRIKELLLNFFSIYCIVVSLLLFSPSIDKPCICDMSLAPPASISS